VRFPPGKGNETDVHIKRTILRDDLERKRLKRGGKRGEKNRTAEAERTRSEFAGGGGQTSSRVRANVTGLKLEDKTTETNCAELAEKDSKKRRGNRQSRGEAENTGEH